jgi:hypothetical protein
MQEFKKSYLHNYFKKFQKSLELHLDFKHLNEFKTSCRLMTLT